jgi:hypothetical protein
VTTHAATAATRPPRCLLVTKEFSLTPTSGGMLRTLALFEQLATHFETTAVSPDRVVVAGPGRAPEPQPVPPAAGGPRERLTQIATTARYRSISGVRIGGERLLDNLRAAASGRYEVGVIGHTCIAGLADDVAAGCDQVLISMHNIESDLMDQRARSAASIATGLPMTVETRLLRRIEADVAAAYPVVVCTEADARALPGARETIVCRNGIFVGSTGSTDAADAASEAPTPRPGSMVFSGALDWEPNVDGLVWFAEQVWPLVLRDTPDARVTVAGRNPVPAVLAACERPGITLVPNPPVMATVLAEHALGIVPLLSGGGSRIKILEYLGAGLDVVSTGVGASGLEDIPDTFVDRLDPDPAQFAQRLVERLTDPREHGAQAQDWVRKHYAWDVTLRPLLDRLVR